MTQTVTVSETNFNRVTGIYRMLSPGELMQPRDSLYDPADDLWYFIELAEPQLVNTPYFHYVGPVRRFNRQFS